MKIGIFGTGMVGEALGTKLVSLGHEVKMGSRTSNNEKARAWAQKHGDKASHGTFAEAAQFGELLINASKGEVTLAVLEAASEQHLGNKVLIDVANPLDFSKGMPPTLFLGNDNSLGEEIQRKFPKLRVVKSLNTMNSNVMVNPGLIPGEHDVFVCGNDAEAKATVVALLRSFGWRAPIDLGDISAARATEALLLPWLRLWQKFGNEPFNFHIAH